MKNERENASNPDLEEIRAAMQDEFKPMFPELKNVVYRKALAMGDGPDVIGGAAAIDAAGASSGDVRKQLTEALGLPTNGIRDGKPVGFAWDYLVAMVRDLAAGASEWQAEPVAYMRTYRAYRDDQSAAPDPGVLVTSFHQNHEYAKQGPGENTPLYLRPSAEIAALRERIAGMEKEAREIERQALERAAQMLEKLADDFAGEYGHDDMGALSFGQGSHAHEKMDKYTDMRDYAESIRALNSDSSSGSESTNCDESSVASKEE